MDSICLSSEGFTRDSSETLSSTSTDIFLAKSLSETREVFHLRMITKRLLLVITAENTLL